MSDKKALLIGGGGTLGGYTLPGLLAEGYSVDIVCLEPYQSVCKKIRYFNSPVTDELLTQLFRENRYDLIIDYIHYPKPEEYSRRMPLLLDNTDQLIFLSSYRVYADEEHPVRETSPQLVDVLQDEYFLSHESYAVPKSINEQALKASGRKNWTVVRPLISFSRFRLDLVTLGAPTLLSRSAAGKPILLPAEARYQTAGVGWAGNIGRMFSGLAGKQEALGEAFTLGTMENPTWEQIAGIYTELMGSEFVWVDTDTYLSCLSDGDYMTRCILTYDRLYDRKVDTTKMMRVTGLKQSDFVPFREGLIQELKMLSENPSLTERFKGAYADEINRRMDKVLETL